MSSNRDFGGEENAVRRVDVGDAVGRITHPLPVILSKKLSRRQ